ncbi:hypothetical protein [Pseudomonas sp. SID14000]|uniref:hypothetical protein n=1 Tax=Pseudomonas sp. SID14000 TaxID=1986221 RepID=UPI000B3C647D|nr:hypothetical protein [Pseudomonas sp. SID14000]
MANQQGNTLLQAKVTDETLNTALRAFDAVFTPSLEADFLVSDEDAIDELYLDEGFEDEED